MESGKFETLVECCENRDIIGFVEEASAFVGQSPDLCQLRDSLSGLMANYRLMQQNYLQNVQDDARDEVFDKLIESMMVLVQKLKLNDKINTHKVLAAASKRSQDFDLPQTAEMLKSHRGDVEFYNLVFSAVLVSMSWNEEMKQYFVSLLLDKDTDPVFSALIVSSLTLSCMVVFDIYKFYTLVDVYEGSDDVVVRERALVGWTFAAGYCTFRGEILNKTLCKLMEKPEVWGEVVELQKQVFYCLDTKQDTEKVEKEMWQPLDQERQDVLKQGWEDCTLDEILESGKEEEAAEKLEDTIKQLHDMQKQGSDIFFGGFSKIKQTPFFHRLSNWFIPFYVSNPALKPLIEILESEEGLEQIRDKSPFCDSDKYSLCFVMKNLMQNKGGTLLKMIMQHGGLFGNRKDIYEGIDRKILVRRSYLQDLYRFFNVSAFKSAFCDLFDCKETIFGPRCVFLSQWSIVGAACIDNAVVEVCRSLMQRKCYKYVWFFEKLLADMKNKQGKFCYLLYLNHEQEYYEALDTIREIEGKLDNKQNLVVKRIKAKCLMEEMCYEEAVGLLVELQQIKPSNSTLLKTAFCMLQTGQVEPALEILYKLDYEMPGNADVVRSLAWGNLLRGNPDKAAELYNKLEKLVESPVASDCFNKGLCYWAQGMISAASDCFVKVVEMNELATHRHGIYNEFEEEDKLLASYHIGCTEKYMMCDIVLEKYKKMQKTRNK